MTGGQARAHQSDPCWSTQHGAFGWCRNLQCAHAFEVGRRKEMRKLCAWDHGDHAVSCLLYTSCQPANPTLYSGIWIERRLRTTAFSSCERSGPQFTIADAKSSKYIVERQVDVKPIELYRHSWSIGLPHDKSPALWYRKMGVQVRLAMSNRYAWMSNRYAWMEQLLTKQTCRHGSTIRAEVNVCSCGQ